MTKHRTTFKKIKENYLLEEDYDEDLELLRQARDMAAREEQDRVRAADLMARWTRFFESDGLCREHDMSGCRECTHYARGGCPSYWEERY